MDNTSQPENELGFYGKDVLFGGQKLFGYWEGIITNLDTNHSFSHRISFGNDGVISEKMAIYHSYGYYGVNQTGDTLFLKNLDYTDYPSTYVYKTTRSDSCIEIDIFITDTSEPWREEVLCPTQTDKTPLISGVNIGNAVNGYGYYGPDVKFGNTTIVGEWREATLDENGSIVFKGRPIEFFEDGTYYQVTDIAASDQLMDYGINEEGNILYRDYSMYEKIIETINDSCYKMGMFLYADDSLDSSYIICKVSE